MESPDERRAYLAAALEEKGVNLKEASEAIGRNHAYIQQYVIGRSPMYLDERDRDQLVRIYGLDGNRLKPPPKSAARKSSTGGGGGQVDSQVSSDLPNETSDQEFFRIWAHLDADVKLAALMLIRAISKLGNREVG